MSKISIVYSAIIDKIESLYPAKGRVHNPYELLDNPEICRKDAWGLRVESAEREDVEFCNLSLNRTFTIVFVRQFVTLGNRKTGLMQLLDLFLRINSHLFKRFFLLTR